MKTSEITAPPTLLIDAGSSRLKWAYWKDGAIERATAINYESDVGVTVSRIPKYATVADVLVASVADDSRTKMLTGALRSRFGGSISLAETTKSCCGVTNGYLDATQLGVDRWLAIVAAWRLYREHLVVVDCGTAVTLDLVDKAGHHQGGQIIPGIQLMARSLFEGTRLSESGLDQSDHLGRSTSQCIGAGSHAAVAGMIDRLVRTVQNTTDPVRVVMTGGDATRLAPLLGSAVEIRPALVLEGLAHWGGLIVS